MTNKTPQPLSEEALREKIADICRLGHLNAAETKVVNKLLELFIQERQAWGQQIKKTALCGHSIHVPGDISGDYEILERCDRKSKKNRVFRVRCIWCNSHLYRYANKFNAKHRFCNNWRQRKRNQGEKTDE